MLLKGIDFTGITVCYFCHDRKGNFVMSFRNKNCRDEHNRWDLGGGGLELHDKVLKTVAKEVKEEYCTKVIKQEFLGYRELHRKNKGKRTHWIALDFKVEVDPTKVRNGEPHKFDKVEWFRFETLPSPLHSKTMDFINKYKEKLV